VIGAAAWLVPIPALADTLGVPGQFRTIQAALNAAHPGDIVLVAPGTYQGPGNTDLDFAGKAVTLRGDGGPGACIIDCNATPSDPRRGLTFHSGETRASILDGFTIRRGATLPGAVLDIHNGAGILINSVSSPTIRNCIIENNHAACWGGGIMSNSGSPLFQNCIVRGNSSDDDGGGVFCWTSGNPVFVNCTFSGNNARASGGGLIAMEGTLTITNCTITNNTAGYCGGVYAFGGSMTNSIIWDNIAPQQLAGTIAITYCDVQGGQAGAGNLNAAPGFADAAAGNFRLLAGSPLIDAGSNAALPAGVTTDLDGNPRTVDGDGNATAVVDIGAFEFQGGARCAADWNNDGTVTSADFFDFLTAFFAANADFNHDGTTDSQDFFDFLGAFFTPCR
jgi:predicted outer membrane repeat protein